jgi:hypothetical protein
MESRSAGPARLSGKGIEIDGIVADAAVENIAAHAADQAVVVGSGGDIVVAAVFAALARAYTSAPCGFQEEIKFFTTNGSERLTCGLGGSVI